MARNPGDRFPPIQQRIINLLSDGMPHDRIEIMMYVAGKKIRVNTLQAHISYIRRVIRPQGEDIVCELYDGTVNYRHIRLLVWPTPTKEVVSNGSEQTTNSSEQESVPSTTTLPQNKNRDKRKA